MAIKETGSNGLNKLNKSKDAHNVFLSHKSFKIILLKKIRYKKMWKKVFLVNPFVPNYSL